MSEKNAAVTEAYAERAPRRRSALHKVAVIGISLAAAMTSASVLVTQPASATTDRPHEQILEIKDCYKDAQDSGQSTAPCDRQYTAFCQRFGWSSQEAVNFCGFNT